VISRHNIRLSGDVNATVSTKRGGGHWTVRHIMSLYDRK